MSRGLPQVKANVMTMIQPKPPLTRIDHMVALGRTIEASRISSDMWIAESAPRRPYTEVSRPTMNERP